MAQDKAPPPAAPLKCHLRGAELGVPACFLLTDVRPGPAPHPGGGKNLRVLGQLSEKQCDQTCPGRGCRSTLRTPFYYSAVGKGKASSRPHGVAKDWKEGSPASQRTHTAHVIVFIICPRAGRGEQGKHLDKARESQHPVAVITNEVAACIRGKGQPSRSPKREALLSCVCPRLPIRRGEQGRGGVPPSASCRGRRKLLCQPGGAVQSDRALTSAPPHSPRRCCSNTPNKNCPQQRELEPPLS